MRSNANYNLFILSSFPITDLILSCTDMRLPIRIRGTYKNNSCSFFHLFPPPPHSRVLAIVTTVFHSIKFLRLGSMYYRRYLYYVVLGSI